MHHPTPYTLNIHGQLLDLSEPQVMGILNVTPDSFFAGSRKESERDIRLRTEQIRAEGGSIVDIGAYSSRSGAADVTPEEEMHRLTRGLRLVREVWPEAIVSVDTFRAAVARRCVEEHGAGLINDISGGDLDEEMFPTVAQLGVPYILMHMQGTPQNMQEAPRYTHLVAEVMHHLAERVRRLRLLGQKDIILDPGFGFAKTLEHNYQLMAHLGELHALELPLLVGVSRKSMIYRLLGCTPQEALNGTTALHALALSQGASILRAHDVREAVETIKIVRACSISA